MFSGLSDEGKVQHLFGIEIFCKINSVGVSNPLKVTCNQITFSSN